MSTESRIGSYIAVGVASASLGAVLTSIYFQRRGTDNSLPSTSYAPTNEQRAGDDNGVNGSFRGFNPEPFSSPVKVIKVFDDGAPRLESSHGNDGQATDRQRKPPVIGCGLDSCICAGPPSVKKGKADPFDARPRSGYLSWEDYFMSVAFLSAQRSKDPNKQVGACIVSSDNVILGIGYNGFPRGCPDTELPWAKASLDQDSLKTKYPYVCHAEMNAIMNKNAASLQGAKMYVTMFPCNECAKLIIQAGIREVIYYEDKNTVFAGVSPTKGGLRADPSYTASKTLLSLSGVKLNQHKPKKPTIIML